MALILLSVFDPNDAAIFNGKVRCFGVFRVKRGDSSVVKNQVGMGRCVHSLHAVEIHFAPTGLRHSAQGWSGATTLGRQFD